MDQFQSLRYPMKKIKSQPIFGSIGKQVQKITNLDSFAVNYLRKVIDLNKKAIRTSKTTVGWQPWQLAEKRVQRSKFAFPAQIRVYQCALNIKQSGTFKSDTFILKTLHCCLEKSTTAENCNNQICRRLSNMKILVYVCFLYKHFLRATGYVLDYVSVVFENTTLFYIWGTFIDSNLCWRSKFGSLNLHFCYSKVFQRPLCFFT